VILSAGENGLGISAAFTTPDGFDLLVLTTPFLAMGILRLLAHFGMASGEQK
jgi:hypothetical protein